MENDSWRCPSVLSRLLDFLSLTRELEGVDVDVDGVGVGRQPLMSPEVTASAYQSILQAISRWGQQEQPQLPKGGDDGADDVAMASPDSGENPLELLEREEWLRPDVLYLMPQ